MLSRDHSSSQPIDPNLFGVLLRNAIAKLGNAHALALYLDVPDRVVYGWVAEGESPPDSVFLRVLDLLEAGED